MLDFKCQNREKERVRTQKLHRYILQLTALFLSVSLLGCFGGVKKTGKVTGYREGQVLTKKGYYQVGELSSDWQRINLEKAMIAFYNPQLKSTISTDSFCDQAYNDSSLKSLTQQLFPGLQNLKVIEEKQFQLDGRGALQTLVDAELDGLPVMVNIVVLKKDWCLFDFYLVSEKSSFARAMSDFEKFYQNFSYLGGD